MDKRQSTRSKILESKVQNSPSMMTTPTKDKKEPNIVWKEMARLCAPWTWKRKEMRGLQVLRASQKLSSLVDSKEGPQAQPFRSGLGPGAGQ